MLLDKDAVMKVLADATSALDALPDSTPAGDVADLQKQIADLTAQLADAQKKTEDAVASLSAEVSKESDLQAQLDASTAKIAKAIADLSGTPSA